MAGGGRLGKGLRVAFDRLRLSGFGFCVPKPGRLLFTYNLRSS